MMILIDGSNKLGVELCEALGIKNARSLEFRIAYDEIATVKVEFYPTINGIKQMIPILREYHLVEKEGSDYHDLTEIGDESKRFGKE